MYRWLNIIFFLSLVCCLIIFFLSFFGRFVFFPLFSRRNPSIRKKQQPTDRQHQQQSNMCPLPRFIPPVVQVCLLCIDRVVCLQSKKPMKRGLWSKTRARYKQNKKWYKLSNCEPFIPLQFPSALSDLDFPLFFFCKGFVFHQFLIEREQELTSDVFSDVRYFPQIKFFQSLFFSDIVATCLDVRFSIIYLWSSRFSFRPSVFVRGCC